MTVKKMLALLCDAMRKGGGRTVRLSKGKDGTVHMRVTADMGVDVRDFYDTVVEVTE